MMQIIDADEWLRRLNAAIARGRGADGQAPDRDTAIKEMHELGLTTGDAEYWLSKRPQGGRSTSPC